MTKKCIIRTSDRVAFKRCRQQWDFGSKIREDWEYVPGVEALDFGTAIHAGLEVYYDPRRWKDDRGIVQQEAKLAFNAHMADWKRRLNRSEQWTLMEKEWHEHAELGIGVLNHFFRWAPEQDVYWEPLKAEIEFEVPIPVPVGYDLPNGFDTGEHLRNYNWDGHDGLYKHVPENNEWLPVVYQGRIDLIARDTRHDKIYIWDHKTAGQFGDYEHLELDTQASSYAWVLKSVLGIDVAGVIFQELRKKAPEEPRVLKTGKLSKDKSQNTTATMYRNAVHRMGFPIEEYADIIDALEMYGQEYFRRIQIDRSPAELDIIERNVLDEALDMLNDPRIYPNPNRFNCGSCRFKDPCLMRQDGSDWVYFLNTSQLFEQRKVAKSELTGTPAPG